jgi:hypothetical protein
VTLDQLLSDFDAAVMRAQLDNREELPAWAHRRAGLVAVVKALRDEFGRIMDPGDDWNRMGVVDVFNEILGSDAGEKVAGNQWTASTQPPMRNNATNAAPAVCEWTMDNRIQRYRPQCNSEGVYHPAYARVICPHCSRRVKLTEANHG